MRYFQARGNIYTDKGIAQPGTRAGRTAIISVAAVVVGVAAMGIFFLRTADESGMDVTPIIPFVAVLAIFAVGAAVFITRRHMGGGAVRIDMSTGVISLRSVYGGGPSRVRLKRSELREVSVRRSSTRSGVNHPVKVVSSRGEHMVAVIVAPDDAREYAAELASLLSVSLRDETGAGA